jgi:hypothetical protein
VVKMLKIEIVRSTLILFSVNAMGRLLRKELLRVTIIQKVNKKKKKAP